MLLHDWLSNLNGQRSFFARRIHECVDHGFDERGREGEDDRVAVASEPRGASSSQIFGSPCNQRLCAGFSWPPAPVLVPRLRPAVDPLDVSGPVSADGSSPAGISDDADPISWSESIVPGRTSCSSYHFLVLGSSVICAWSDRLVSEIPSRLPFSLASSLRSMNLSGVPPASCEAGVAQPEGPVVIEPGSISFTVSIRFDRRPSMWSTEPPLVPHDAFGVGYGAGTICITISLRFEIPGGPPVDRLGARSLISAICSSVFGVAWSCACGVGYGAGISAVSLAASSNVVPALPSIM